MLVYLCIQGMLLYIVYHIVYNAIKYSGQCNQVLFMLLLLSCTGKKGVRGKKGENCMDGVNLV